MKKGFTLVELLVVIAIIGVVLSVTMASLSKANSKARDARRITDFNQIRTALELFYTTYGRYPVTDGAPTWDGHWQILQTCLETGVNCGPTVPNYVPVMSKVPNDPLDNPNTLDDNDPTYYYGYPSACSTGAVYRLAVYLENNHPVLNTDLDGSFYNNNNGCQDSNRGYCIGTGSCSGW